MRNLWLLFVLGLATGFVSEKLLVSSQPSLSVDDLYLEGRSSGDFPVDDEDDEDFGSGSGSGDSLSDVLQSEVIMRKINIFLNTSMATPTQETSQNQPTTTAASPPNPPTTAGDSQDPPTTVEDTVTSPYIFPEEEKEPEMEEPVIGPTSEFIDSTSPSSTNLPPSETTATKHNVDISLTKDTSDGILPEDSWDDLTAEDGRDEVLSKEGRDESIAKDGRGSKVYELDAPEEVTSENLWERTEVLAAVIACGVVGFLCAVFLLLLLAYRMKKKDEGSYDLGETKVPPTAYQKAPTKEFYA
ncbi:syndecan-2-like [Centroberyx affinis]|uniref:syndecan-2-like n=1 Tax=Centroberyx affinis TaxID=166261 RepID=UPI003A5B9D85